MRDSEHPLDLADDGAVAVIGMAGRFPGAPDLDAFWSNLAAGVESIDRLSDDELRRAGVSESLIASPDYVRAVPRLDNVRCFDAELFGYSPREAATMDPQGRIGLELSWHALEDAGYAPGRIEASVGVFATTSLNTYLLGNLRGAMDDADFVLGLGNIPFVVGNAPDFVASRISYKLNLRGPSMAVQTACSSSLAAIHMARQSLLNGECDMAIAGGVSIYLPQDRGYQFHDGMILSKSGHCRAFDADADGILFGRGGGMVVLKLLSRAIADGDRVRAVVRGSAVNNDGAQKVGFTAPSVAGQAQVIAEALGDAGIRADAISYVEAHGTGTRVGDPIEIAGLTEAFRKHTQRTGFCALGTVKTNIGHLDVAAGVTGFIKTVLMLEHRQLAPSLNFKRANPGIDFDSSPFSVNTALKPWNTDDRPRRAGVSAFGFGGTNVHVILEEAPPLSTSRAENAEPAEMPGLLRLTAQTPETLASLCAKYAAHLTSIPSAALADVCRAANVGRAHLPERVVARGDVGEIVEGLRAAARGSRHPAVARGRASSSPAGTAFLFSGMGSQFNGMGEGLYKRERVFRETLERCDGLLRAHLDRSLLDILFPARGAPSSLEDTTYTQPALFAFEYALASLWRSWGLEPQAVIGHSLGEYVAACVAGLFTLDEGLRLVAQRGRLMGSLPRNGAMAAVLANEQELLAALGTSAKAIEIAALNGPRSLVMTGPADAVRANVERLEDAGIESQLLNVTHAFHSSLLDPVLDAYEKAVANTRFDRLRIPLVSNLTGEVLGEAMARDPRYWRRHAREPVRFAAGIETLLTLGVRHFVEVGPHTVASGLATACVGDREVCIVSSLRRGRDDLAQLGVAAGELYVRGALEALPLPGDATPVRRRALPLYPFARTEHWVETAGPRESIRAGVHATPRSGSAGDRLLGSAVRSPALAHPAFDLRTDFASHAFLADHRVRGLTVFPATGYVEAALEAAESVHGRPACTVSELEISEALVLDDEGRTQVQVVLKAETAGHRFEVYAAASEDTAPTGTGWRLYGQGRVDATLPQYAARMLPISEVRARCASPESGDAFYAALLELGFGYGPGFRGIERLWRGAGELLAEVSAPVAREPHSFRLHPGAFDACLQTVLALAPKGRTFLPIRFGEIRMHAELTTTTVVHAWINHDSSVAGVEQDARSLRASVTIAAPDGPVLIEVADILLREVDTPRSVAWMQWLYGIDWVAAASLGDTQRASRSDASASAVELPQLAAGLMTQVDAVRERHGLAEYDELQAALDTACRDFALAGLTALGWRPMPGDRFHESELSERLGVKSAHRAFLHRLLEMGAEDGYLESPRPGEWRLIREPALASPAGAIARLRERFPRFAKMFELVERCGEGLAPGLRGEILAVDLLFPRGSLTDLETLYHQAPFTAAYNEIAVAALRQLVACSGDRPLRILEIGAGTGSTTAALLPCLPRARTRYVYTDVSPLFLARAEERFSEYPFLEYRLLDADHDPRGQGYDPGAYDIVVASNVLHATADLARTVRNARELLAPGGTLLLVEGIARQRWVDLLFGLTEGWWAFEDTHLRPDYPLLGQEIWLHLLKEAGFVDAVCVPGSERPAALFHQAVLLAKRPSVEVRQGEVQAAADVHPHRWLCITADEPGARNAFAGRADILGREPCIEAGPLALAERLMRNPVEHLVIMADLDGAAGAAIPDAAEPTIRAILTATQALANVAENPPRLWIVTTGAQPVAAADPVSAFPAATAWGMANVISLEHAALRCTCVDLDPGAADNIERLMDEIAADGEETRIALRKGRRHVARLARVSSSRTPDVAERGERLAIGEQGVLESLHWEPHDPRAPEAGEVEIAVCATGLNFKDVLTAFGRFEAPVAGMGHECSGRVTALGPAVTGLSIGDEVIAFVPGALAGRVLADARLVVRKPESLSHEAAATIAGGFLTAHHGLHGLAELKAGERVLIHAASGGVGLAAVQLALRARAEVYATASTEEKRAFLRSLGVHHVLGSRDTTFAAAIKQSTNGRGVDVVLNSVTGDLLRATAEILSANGRFVELSRTGEARPVLPPGARYFSPDVASQTYITPEPFGKLLREIVQDIERGDLLPLPVRTFPRGEVTAAFRLMARGGHIGKVVVRFDTSRASAATSVSDLIRSEGAYVIAGGLGGLGLLVADWLVDHGARHLHLLARRQPLEREVIALARLQERGAHVHVLHADVSDADQVRAAMRTVKTAGRPLRGVIQAAGILDDGVLEQQTWARFDRVLAPKVAGSWNLHEGVEGESLDFFVLFSSIASLLGSAGQANHAAANAFMDALAAHRRSRGLPALSINWGAWSEVGAAARGGIAGRIAARGLGEISPRQGLDALEFLMVENARGGVGARVGVVPVDWDIYRAQFGARQEPRWLADLPRAGERRTPGAPVTANPVLELLARAAAGEREAIVAEYIRAEVAKGLGLDPAARIDRDQPLSTLGLDSLLAVELRTTLSRGLALRQRLPATLLFDYPSIAALTRHVLTRLAPAAESPAAAASAASGESLSGNAPSQLRPSAIEADVAAMSDAEAEALLLKELQE